MPNAIFLTLDAPLLSKKDAGCDLFLIDATWKKAEIMARQTELPAKKRRLPTHFRTAYPRRQDDCTNPDLGLASIEALYIAFHILDWPTDGLLDNYHWKDEFLSKNAIALT